jgi:hypothetical protein
MVDKEEVPDHPQEHQGLHQGQQEMAIQQGQEQEGKHEGIEDLHGRLVRQQHELVGVGVRDLTPRPRSAV